MNITQRYKPPFVLSRYGRQIQTFDLAAYALHSSSLTLFHLTLYNFNLSIIIRTEQFVSVVRRAY